MPQDNSKKNVMNSDGAPVVEDANLPEMDDFAGDNVMGVPERITGKNLMKRVSRRGSLSASDEMQEYPDMEPIEAEAQPSVDASSFAAEAHGEGYLRLLVEVNQGTMRVVDATVVDGPLVEEDLTGEMIYQALLNNRRVGAGAFPDLSVQSGFAPPDDEGRGHSHTELTSYQFVVRIPRAEITLSELSDLEIELVRPSSTTALSSEMPVGRSLSFSDAAAEFEAEAPEVVARLEGVDLDALSENASNSLRAGLR